MVEVLLLEQLVELTMCSSSVKLVSAPIKLLDNIYLTLVFFFSGYSMRHAKWNYCSIDPDLQCNTACKKMRRNRFFKIKYFLHATDNKSLSKSRVDKFEPLYDLFHEWIKQFDFVHENNHHHGIFLWLTLLQAIHLW